jgi:hypothetical protein
MGVAERENELDTEQEQTEEVSTEEQVEQTEAEETTEESEEGTGEEDVVQIGEEETPASEETRAADTNWVNDLRRRYRELKRDHAKLLSGQQTGQPAKQAPRLPEKPKLADHDYDEDKFQEAMDAWYVTKREVEAHEAEQENTVKERQKAVQTVHENYATSKKALKVPDFQDAEDEVVGVLSEVQQSILMAGATNPGAMVYALGRTPKKLQELASIKDPVKFAVAVGKLETEVKVTKRTSTKPAPEMTVTGKGSTGTSKATLERLQAEADRTGDRTKVAQFLRNQRQAGK